MTKMNSLKVKIKSVSPILMHSSRLANPLDPETISLKRLTSKRKKTEEDLLEIAKAEWVSSMYFDNTMGPYIPGQMIEACLIEAAKLTKSGKIMKRAIFVTDDKIKLVYKGPRDIESLYGDPRFVDCRAVSVNRAKIMRYRPKFDNWSCSFEVLFNPEQIDKETLRKTMIDAGQLIGIGDYRPRFGRFETEF